MQLYGLAILPNLSDSKKILELRNSLGDLLEGPVLGLDINLPHATILQCPFDPRFLDTNLLKDIAKKLSGNYFSPVNRIELRKPNWIFAMLENSDPLKELQSHALALMKDFILVSKIQPRCPTPHYSTAELDYYNRYGYRYLFDEYIPHVTLGLLPKSKNDIKPIQEILHASSLSKGLNFNRIAFYKAGYAGTFIQTLVQQEL